MDPESLAPEQIDKAKTCKSPEELAALAEGAGMELSDDMLKGVVGGIDMPVLPDERIDCHEFFIS